MFSSVTVTDGDPNYPKRTHTITTSNDLNTSKIGSTAIFTYTAKPDGAGNLGPSVTRNVTIVGYSSTAGLYHDLNGAQYITTVTLNTSTYALVSSDFDGIQVINLASPDVSVFSNNTNNPSYAKTGDSLSITLMATDIIGSGSATILGLDADVSHVDETLPLA